MIWLTGLYSEVIHFLLSCLLAWVVLRLISGTFLTSLLGDRLAGVLVIALAFGVGGLVHLWLDSWQNLF